MIGAPLILPLSLAKGVISEPVKVTAPMATPIESSIKLSSFTPWAVAMP